MSNLLIETIQILKEVPQNLEWHEKRMRKSLQTLSGGNFKLSPDFCDIQSQIQFALKKFKLKEFKSDGNWKLPHDRIKCRLSYSLEKIEKIELFPYQKLPIKSLKLIENNDIEYSLKFANRTELQNLHQQKNNADEVLIIKNGFVTDTTFANVVFEKSGKFFTPNTPLLRGTKRTQLLTKRIIKEKTIRKTDIKYFEQIHLINAMLDLGETVIPVKNIL